MKFLARCLGYVCQVLCMLCLVIAIGAWILHTTLTEQETNG